jgi:hypothetical protein
MRPHGPPHKGPKGPVERAADDALEAFNAGVCDAGGKVEYILIYGVVEGLEPTGVTAALGLDDSELLAYLVTLTRSVAESQGIELRITVMPKIGNGHG